MDIAMLYHSLVSSQLDADRIDYLLGMITIPL